MAPRPRTACTTPSRRRVAPGGRERCTSEGRGSLVPPFGRAARVQAVRLALEHVVEVEVLAPAPREETRQDVRRDDEQPPPLALLNVDVLVVAGLLDALPVLSQDH